MLLTVNVQKTSHANSLFVFTVEYTTTTTLAVMEIAAPVAVGAFLIIKVFLTAPFIIPHSQEKYIVSYVIFDFLC